jgi:hypothetical protein
MTADGPDGLAAVPREHVGDEPLMAISDTEREWEPLVGEG